ncbi:MAG: VWA domain-containing protein [Firmicutes bacterium]|nr:VWA domain-containing protein [Bacillota bacterium]
MKKNNNTAAIIGIAVAVIALVFGGVALTRNIGKSEKTVSKEAAQEKLEKYYKKIAPGELTPVKGQVSYSDEESLYQELPELKDDSIVVRETTGDFAEIFVSSEKTGTGTDGYLREMAEKFNRSGMTVGGRQVSVRIRTVSSGQQVDYPASGKYIPDAISPSSDLSVKMLNAKGVPTVDIDDSLVMNYAGIVVSNSTYSTLVEEYGGADVKNFAQATADGKITVGYTNPFTSATGMNFLVTLLDSYDSGNILSDRAIQGFQAFQENVPFVAMTTGQMRNAAERGSFDAFVLEYQVYVNDSKLSKNYRFIPFGYAHKNPLAMIETSSKKDILTAFADYCELNGAQLAEKDGFNQNIGYTPSLPEYSGADLMAAQKLYKENKDSQPVVCVFVTDVSGSMAGEPLNTLKDSLINSMQYINTNNYIGLVCYNEDVDIALPIAEFDINQQSYFKGTVESLDASGATATFDGVCVALKMIEDKLEEVPNAKPMVFVLSDGETNRGHDLKDIEDIVSGLSVPVYTIGYNADIDALSKLSDINEGVCINANTDDVIYQLKQLFNANM